MGHIPLFEIVLRKILAVSTSIRPARNLTAPDSPVVICLSQAITWRSTTWWKTLKELGSDLGSQDWRHDATFRSRGRTWDWILVHCLGDSWESACASLSPRDPHTQADFLVQAMEAVKLSRPSYAASWKARNHDFNSSVRAPAQPREVSALPGTPSVRGHDGIPVVTIYGDSKLAVDFVNGTALCRGYLSKYICKT